MDCQSTGAYGYTYPEIAAAGPVSPDQLSQIIRDTVDQLYGGGSVFSAFTRSDVAVDSLSRGVSQTSLKSVVKGNQLHIPKQALFAVPHGKTLHASNPTSKASSGPYSSDGDYVVTPETYRDWIANVTLEKYALGGTGRVSFFCGHAADIPSNPLDWHKSSLYVGSFSVFASDPVRSGCQNCKDQAANGSRIGGTVHLTKTLIRNHVPLTGNEPINYLAHNLHWRLSTVHDGAEKDREEVPSLKVVVQSAGYDSAPGFVEGRPVRGQWTRHAPVTRGRLGGVDHGEDF